MSCGTTEGGVHATGEPSPRQQNLPPPPSPSRSQAEYDSVVDHARLPELQLFSMPIVMDTNDASVRVGDLVKLRWAGADVAVLDVSSVWEADKTKEVRLNYGRDGGGGSGVCVCLRH